MDAVTGNVITAAISALPSILALLKSSHAADNPGAAPITDSQALAALQAAVQASIARDEELKKIPATAAALGVHDGGNGESEQ